MASQCLPTPARSIVPCQVCTDVANESSPGPTNTCGEPSHRLIESLRHQIDHVNAELEAARRTIRLGQATEEDLRVEMARDAALHNQEKATERALFNTEKNQLNLDIQELTEQVNALQAKLDDKKRVRTERTWQQLVREHIQGTGDESWEDIYKRCCREENMSVSLKWIHPNIRLQGAGITGIGDMEVEHPTPVPEVPFPFEQLPWGIQAEIFALWLHKPGQLIHALSRLDRFNELTAFPEDEELNGRSGLPRGFYWGKTHYNVTKDRRDPNDVLRILLVSKRFYFIGVHCFYGTNTFAFSSLGEFDRFCNGIGDSRIARIQNIELTWQGSQYLTTPAVVDDKGVERKNSRRTSGLYALQSCYRLRTLVVHINETGKIYIRRKNELKETQDFMQGKTQGQPNQRMTRALRCVQGLDCIYQLRGLTWIRFYDLFKAVGAGRNTWSGERVDITDWSFAEDIINVTTLQKVPSRRERSSLKKLPSLFHDDDEDSDGEDNHDGRWTPSAVDWEIVHTYYHEDDGRGSYDHLRRMGNHQDLDLPSHMSMTDRSEERFHSDSDTTESSDSDSDGGGGEGRRPPRPGPRGGPSRRGFFRGGFSGRARCRGGISRGGPSGRGRMANGRGGSEPSLNDLLRDIRNGIVSDSSESDDSDSELKSDTNSDLGNRISLITDDEDDQDDRASVIVVDDDSDDDSDMFVRQDGDGLIPSVNSPGPGPSTGESSNIPLGGEDSVVAFPWGSSLHRQFFHGSLASRPNTSRDGSGSSSTQFVGRLGERAQSVKSEDSTPSIKSEDPTPVIEPDRANEMIDLTGDDDELIIIPAILPTIIEVDEDEEEEEDDDDGKDVLEGDTLMADLPLPTSPKGSKRSSGEGNSGDEEDKDEDGDEDAPSPPKRLRMSSLPGRSPPHPGGGGGGTDTPASI